MEKLRHGYLEYLEFRFIDSDIRQYLTCDEKREIVKIYNNTLHLNRVINDVSRNSTGLGLITPEMKECQNYWERITQNNHKIERILNAVEKRSETPRVMAAFSYLENSIKNPEKVLDVVKISEKRQKFIDAFMAEQRELIIDMVNILKD